MIDTQMPLRHSHTPPLPPSSLTEAAKPQAADRPGVSASQNAPAFKLVARGFTPTERSLLQGTVMVSQRRTPRLQLLSDSEVTQADVVLIDTRDAEAMSWAARQPTLAKQMVIWVDGQTAGAGHMTTRRPVQWPSLPMLLARALETHGTLGPPASPPGNGTPATRPADAAAALPVLVVDDSLAIRAYLTSQLEARGHEVVQTENAEAAIQLASNKPFSCILMDVLMPGIDGYDACRQIKARLRGTTNVPVIMLTSKSSPFDRIRGKMAGCDAYLTKPVDPQQLHEVVARYAPAPLRAIRPS